MAKNSRKSSKNTAQVQEGSSMAPLFFTGVLILLPVLYLLFKKKPYFLRKEAQKTSPKPAKKKVIPTKTPEVEASNELSKAEIKKLLK